VREKFDQLIAFYTTKDQAAAIEMLSERTTYGNQSQFMRAIVDLYLQHVGATAPRQMTNGHVEQRETV
jgi:hypothetical protein